MKRTYRSPLSLPTEVSFERALLVATTVLVEVDELENVNIEEGSGGVTEQLYFEF